MARPWNRIVVDDDPDHAEMLGDGSMRQGIAVGFCDEDVEAMRAGYKCVQCFENLDHAFPDVCPVCTFPMKEHQSEQFARIFKGHVPGMRTGIDIDAEIDRIAEQRERRAFHKRARESGISVPKSF